MSRILCATLICTIILCSCNPSPQIQNTEPKVYIRGIVTLEDCLDYSEVMVSIPELEQVCMTDSQGSYLFETDPRNEPITVYIQKVGYLSRKLKEVDISRQGEKMLSRIILKIPTILSERLVGEELNLTYESSPYLVNQNVLVGEGDTLTIEPGVEVYFSGPYYILIEGLFNAIGTAIQKIHFSGIDEGEGTWKGIHCIANNLAFTDGVFSAGSFYEPIYSSGNVIRHAQVDNSYWGISGNVWIEDCVFDTSSYALGFGFEYATDSKYFSGILKNCIVDGNITVNSGMLVNNMVTSNKIHISNQPKIRPSIKPYLYSNRIHSTGNRSSFFLSLAVSYAHSHRLVNNSISGFSSLYTYTNYHGSGFEFMNNTFENCGFESLFSSQKEGDLVRNEFIDCSFAHGREALYEFCFENSNFIRCETIVIDTQKASLANFRMRGNYWGDINTQELLSASGTSNVTFIFDYYDDFNFTKVDYSNWSESRHLDAGYLGNTYPLY